MQLTAAQLAEATDIPPGKAVRDFVCFDAAGAMVGELPTLRLSRVCTNDGKSLEGKDRVGLFTILLPLVLGLGQGGPEAMAEHLRAAEQQESGASGAAAAKRAIGARALLTEVLHLLRDFVKETGTFLVLPAMPTSGKAPARGSGSTPATPVSASGAASVAGPAPAPSATPAVTAASAPATTAPAAAAPAAAATAATSTTASTPITAAQELAANHKVMVSVDKAYMDVVTVTTGPAEVLSAFLTVLQVMRNIGGAYTWTNLRDALVAAHQIMTAVGEPAAKLKVITDAAARGDRLVAAISRTAGAAAGVHVLEMFTNLLPNAHGVANNLFAADVARIRKSLGGVHISSTGVAMGGVGYGQPLLPVPPPPPLFPGGGAIGIPPAPMATATAPWQGRQPQAPRPPRRQARSSAASSYAHGAAGYYAPGPPGRNAGGRGRGSGGGATGAQKSASQLQMEADIRNQKNHALQQQQLANPGIPGSFDPCRKCVASGRDPHHDHLKCAFWICSRCKEGGHRRPACTNPPV